MSRMVTVGIDDVAVETEDGEPSCPRTGPPLPPLVLCGGPLEANIGEFKLKMF